MPHSKPSKPNLQNVPLRTETGKKLREAFTKNCPQQVSEVDYETLELLALAALLDADD